jgi:hypothetical protein
MYILHVYSFSKINKLQKKLIRNRYFRKIWVGFIVFNATFNNISVISWQLALLVEETGENQRPVANH